jgi:hypothetical protein
MNAATFPRQGLRGDLDALDLLGGNGRAAVVRTFSGPKRRGIVCPREIPHSNADTARITLSVAGAQRAGNTSRRRAAMSAELDRHTSKVRSEKTAARARQ